MTSEEFFTGVEQYVEATRKELHARWEAWEFDPNKPEIYEAIGGLMAREVTLSTQIALNPGMWNGHVAPLLLRSMIDSYITFAWIWGDPHDRAQKFILYGLGQEKLQLEHFKNTIDSEEDPEDHPVVKARRAWIDSQRYTFLTEVNVGSWSGKSTRAMAQEAGCMSIYRHAYQPFSAATHGMWNHIARYNLQYCDNPLHRYHRVPFDPELQVDPDYLFRAAKYVGKTLDTFDEKTSVRVDVDSSFDLLSSLLSDMDSENRRAAEDKEDSETSS